MAGYNNNITQQQLSDLMRQFQQLNTQVQTPLYPNPVPQVSQVQVPVISHQVQYVQGLAGAKLYQENLSPNCSEIIMDKDENIFYMVSKDANGTPSKQIPIGRFNLEENTIEEPQYLTRKDLDDFKNEIRDLLTQSKQVTLSSSKKEASK